MPSIVKKISKFTKREIDYLFCHARRVVKNQFCTILVAPRQNTEFGRVLIIASRKVGNAPERNLNSDDVSNQFFMKKSYLPSILIVW